MNKLRRSTRKQNLRQPVRIVIDSQNRVTPEHRIVQQPGETLASRVRRKILRVAGNGAYLPIPEHKGHLDLVVLMMQLGKQQINSIWVEAEECSLAHCCRRV